MQSWKQTGRFFWLGGLLAIAACAPQSPTYPLLHGGSISLSSQPGKVIFINYWAEWCAPCREEIPELNRLYQQHPGQILVLGVNFDGVTGDKLAAQAKAMGIEFPLLLANPMPDLGLKASGALPETLVLDGQGRHLKTLLGPQTKEKLLQVASQVNKASKG